ncbi:MAG: hypothetical protein L6Q77_10920 [Bacteroidetes bacterium]|nr:hypothetical protein [Bacteroidota bacterium]
MISIISKSKLLPLLILFLMVLHINRIAVMVGLYYYQQAEITRLLCEKKKTGCNGKCYLSKQVKSAEAEPGQEQEKAGLPSLPVLLSKSAPAEYLHQDTQSGCLCVSSLSTSRILQSPRLSAGFPVSLIKPPVLTA